MLRKMEVVLNWRLELGDEARQVLDGQYVLYLLRTPSFVFSTWRMF